MHDNDDPRGINPMPPIDSFMRAYRQLCQIDERDEPIDETVAQFAIRVVQRCDDAGLIETSLGCGEVVTAETLIEGRYL